MKKFVVRYEERLARRFIIKAENQEDAFNKFYEKANDGSVQLDYDDFYEDFIEVIKEADESDIEIYDNYLVNLKED